MAKNRLFIVLQLLLVFALQGIAQNDVMVSVQVIPPYSPYISTYVDQPNKLILNIQNLTTQTKNVKLWVRIAGDNGTSAVTMPNFQPSAPIVLTPGQFRVIDFSSNETRSYFDAANFNLTGITKLQLLQNQALPEGSYTICVRALDYNTSAPLSMDQPSGCSAPFPIYYIDPPQTMQPMCETDIIGNIPQNIVFTWTPPATAPGNVQYEFTLKEVPNTLNPNDVVKNGSFPVVYSTTVTATTTFVYTQAYPQLVTGKKYVWRVRAKDPMNGVQFKNQGFSQACTFNYKSQPQAGQPAIQTGGNDLAPGVTTKFYPIKLKYPIKGEENKWIVDNYDNYNSHHLFEWEDIGNAPAMGYHVKFCKINPGQTAQQAIEKNNDENGMDKGDPSKSPFKYRYKLTPGVYAWQVNTNGFKPSDIKYSDIETFVVTKADSFTAKKFEMCGYTINITKLTNAESADLTGEGYFELYKYGPKINVKFHNLVVRNFSSTPTTNVNGTTGILKGDWRCTQGTIETDLKEIPSKQLKTDNGIEGDFLFKPTYMFINATMKTAYDANKQVYTDVSGDKGEGCSARMNGEIKWTTPYTQLTLVKIKGPWGVGSYLSEEPIVIKAASGSAYTGYGDKFSVSGSFKITETYNIDLDYPKNSSLKIIPGSELQVSGDKAYIKLSGSFTTPDGSYLFYGGQLHEQLITYDFSNQTSMLMKGTLKGNEYDIFLDKKGLVKMHMNPTAWIKLTSINPYGCNASGYGLIFDYTKVKFKKGDKINDLSFGCAFNYGDGFKLYSKAKYINDLKISSFKTDYDNMAIYVSKSTLTYLTIDGSIEVPFINAKAPFQYSIDGKSVEDSYVDLPNTETVILDNGVDKITVKPSAAFIKTDEILLDAEFSFNNKNGKNLTVKKLPVKGVKIKADGSASLGAFGWYFNQKTGNYNGYVFKALHMNIKTTGGSPGAKTYQLQVTGNIVLEEKTLASNAYFPIYYSFTLPDHYIDNNKVDQSLTASLEGSGESMLPVPVAPAAPPANLDVSSGQVKAGFQNDACDFTGNFKYLNDATYGVGFLAESDVDIYNPCQGTVHMKLMVGKKGSYKYWFIEAGQKNLVTFPTGVLDLTVYGFQGRMYYHMDHTGTSINASDYVPSSSIGFGVFALVDLKTAASNGGVFWGPLSTEIRTWSGGGLKDIKIHGEGQILSSGVDNYDGMAHGYADLIYNHNNPRYLSGVVSVQGDIYNQIQFGGALNFYFASSDWYVKVGSKKTPIWAHVNTIGKDMSAYFGVQKDGGNAKITAGVSGSLFEAHPGTSGCLIDCYFGCCCSAGVGADVSVSGALDAAATFPDLQISGAVSLAASAGVYANACGIGISPTIGATLTGNFTMPSPFCVGGSATIVTPSPFPNISFSVRYKDGGIELGKSDCWAE
jgi:TANFOR domain-containing protein